MTSAGSQAAGCLPGRLAWDALLCLCPVELLSAALQLVEEAGCTWCLCLAVGGQGGLSHAPRSGCPRWLRCMDKSTSSPTHTTPHIILPIPACSYPSTMRSVAVILALLGAASVSCGESDAALAKSLGGAAPDSRLSASAARSTWQRRHTHKAHSSIVNCTCIMFYLQLSHGVTTSCALA